MDINNVWDIEFLDLNGMDEAEKLQLRTSLQLLDPCVQLPWVRVSKKTTANSSLPKEEHFQQGTVIPNAAHPSPQTAAPFAVIQPTAIPSPILGNVYLNSEHAVQPVVVPAAVVPGYTSPPNLVYITSPVPPPTVGAYAQPVIVTGAQKIVPQTNITLAYNQPSAYQEPIQHVHKQPQQVYSPQNGVVLVESNSTEHMQTSVPHVKREAAEVQPIKVEVETPQSAPEQASAVQIQPEVFQNGMKTETVNSQPAGKSWASLFNDKAKMNAANQSPVTSQSDITINQSVRETYDKDATDCPFKRPRTAEFLDPVCYRIAEFLTSHVVDGKAVSLQPRGLLNKSNYCYVNSILQALIACPPMYNMLNSLAQNVKLNSKRKRTPFIDGMCRFVREFKHLPANQRVTSRRSDGKNTKKDQGIMVNTDVPFEPLWIQKMLNAGRQEDAEEFLGFLLNGLNDEMLEVMKLIKSEDNQSKTIKINEDDVDKGWQVMGPKNKGSVTRRTDFGRTPISDIFGGFLRSRIHRTGDLITENIQPFFTLQLNIEKVATVREALEALVTKNQLEGLTSLKTNEEVEAWQQVVLDELPVILILHLKCFDYKMHERTGCTKIVKALEFPIDLKIDSKLLSSKSLTPKEKQYKLIAVVYHDGKEATAGHYVTDAFHVGYGCWLRYDDASVRSVSEEQVLRPQGIRVPYLLFYRRSDTIRK
ncbi:unnamed protein product [Acanthoscelides obtectus]|uniref:ubiquitinyl hydrolase 1 n=1 Tax=Acanthoscelides obtectus TaxID=200917 RepID=A0A9P0LID7_ACAOB|nr:unnamed protein product [Acanthoscelides obtectus]CAK1640300.1 Ubiquitin carboxyl-terminal hydrolase 10 [Acanthoscelides obtectus]